MRLSCSAMPPLMLRCGFGRTCFFTIITCSTSNLRFVGKHAQHAPFLALVPSGDHLHGVVPPDIHSFVSVVVAVPIDSKFQAFNVKFKTTSFEVTVLKAPETEN